MKFTPFVNDLLKYWVSVQRLTGFYLEHYVPNGNFAYQHPILLIMVTE